ncbi:hypothetical protein PHIM7_342 [Sinorhizobium phage phiM7]|uniref:Uncharacterized protein n=3 Tax=Emdodecavirus TaxID=1980937 RepID=S5MVY6_9CAUD|nr:hypothetical protein AB690_gp173 [Sinorhizobium phage phiM12]YP_009212587.1 hypothetical protein AVT40_gp186 [Sinorhizobium phage phiN3]YP_009601467.1 hypothetical protein FDH46_gp136 [Sinorhizobium phage phiM7]AKF13247.1 hypothetical protein PHIM19_342 [Sinorhizobium phage phiM19]AGR48072.1 hypothetical protein SmphiM12_440 [Sinorhizobium phage phiM12]AKF12887.1 hypothetical protein PHIM7_342 [Sinorhizobium phage phiM7]AKF13610.1 hypothetical protein PHIN3_347 [Sinorhizobium phage phiN3]
MNTGVALLAKIAGRDVLLDALWRWVDDRQTEKMEEEASVGAEDCAAARVSGYLTALDDVLTKIEELQTST